MANEYTDLATLKLALKIIDTDRDSLLTKALSAAARGIDRVTGRRFYTDGAATARVYPTRNSTVSGCDGEALLVDDISTLTGLVAEVGDGTTWTAVTDFFSEPHNALVEGRPVTRLRRDLGFWSTSTQVRVTARWGWPAVPDEVVQANLLQAVRLYTRKDSPEGVAGSAEWGVIRMARIDPDVQALIQHLMLPGFG